MVRRRLALTISVALLLSNSLPGAGMQGLRFVASARAHISQANDAPIISVGVERSVFSSYEDRGTPGISPGDRFHWGPNPLYDAENVLDTGVSVQGMCAVFNNAGDCWVVETITFGLDGSTLLVHGILPGNGDPATLTIFAGTGIFATTTGTVTVIANPDGDTWFRRFELIM